MAIREVAMAAISVVSAAASGGARLGVRVYDYARLPHQTLREGMAEARRIFEKAGIETEWFECPLEGRYASCEKPVTPSDVTIRIVPRSMEGYPVPSWAFGFALPSGAGRPASHAYVFSQRVTETSRRGGFTPFRLFGHVMAHEVSHLLLGADAHSPRGLMRGRWEKRELMQAERGELVFTRGEATLLRSRVRERLANAPANPEDAEPPAHAQRSFGGPPPAVRLSLLIALGHALRKRPRLKSYDDFEDIELHSTILIDKLGRVHWARSGGDPFTDVAFLTKELARMNAAVKSQSVGGGGR